MFKKKLIYKLFFLYFMLQSSFKNLTLIEVHAFSSMHNYA